MKTNHRRFYVANTPRYKGGTEFLHLGALSGLALHARADWDFSNGHRGMAKSVRGARKFVNSRLRFHENAATRHLAAAVDDADP